VVTDEIATLFLDEQERIGFDPLRSRASRATVNRIAVNGP